MQKIKEGWRFPPLVFSLILFWFCWPHFTNSRLHSSGSFHAKNNSDKPTACNLPGTRRVQESVKTMAKSGDGNQTLICPMFRNNMSSKLISPFYQCWHDSLKVVYFKNSCVKLMAEELCAQHLLLLTQITKHLFWGWMINNWTCNGTEICVISKPHSPAMPETWLKCENKQTHAVLSVCFVISATSRLKKKLPSFAIWYCLKMNESQTGCGSLHSNSLWLTLQWRLSQIFLKHEILRLLWSFS